MDIGLDRTYYGFYLQHEVTIKLIQSFSNLGSWYSDDVQHYTIARTKAEAMRWAGSQKKVLQLGFKKPSSDISVSLPIWKDDKRRLPLAG